MRDKDIKIQDNVNRTSGEQQELQDVISSHKSNLPMIIGITQKSLSNGNYFQNDQVSGLKTTQQR